MAERFEVAGAPLALGRGLDEDPCRRPAGQEFIEALPISLSAALDEFAVGSQDGDLAGCLVEVDANKVYCWS
jgi:hypothetical protein